MKIRIFTTVSLVVVLFLASLSFRPNTVNAEGCGGLTPSLPVGVWTSSGPGAGEVTLHWQQSPHADRYAVAYGTSSGNYTYGADNIGGSSSTSYVVRGLNPGGRYYFVLAAAHGCNSSGFSAEVMAYAGGGAAVSASTEDKMEKTTMMEKKTVMKKDEPVVESKVIMPKYTGSGDVWASSGPMMGQVTLGWKKVSPANNYHVVYGSAPGSYEYGALNVGDVSSFTVGFLVPGKMYYFAVVPVHNDTAMYTSSAVSAWAYGGVSEEVVETTKEALMEPKNDTMVKGVEAVDPDILQKTLNVNPQ